LINCCGKPSWFPLRDTLNQTARQGLSDRIRFASANIIFSLEVCLATVSIDSTFLTGQQLGGHGNIMLVRSGHLQRVDNTAVLIYANVRLVAEMPSVTLLRLMSIRITLLFLILGRTGGRNDGGIHDRPFSQNQTTLCQQTYHLRKQLLLQIILHQKISKMPQRIAIWYLIAGIHTAKLGESATIYHLCHGCHVGEVVQILNQIDSQHTFQIIGLVATISIIVARIDERNPLSLGNDAIDLRQKLFFSGPHLCQFIAQAG